MRPLPPLQLRPTYHLLLVSAHAHGDRMSTRQADLCIGPDNGHMMSPFVSGSCQVGDTVRLMIDYGATDPGDVMISLSVGPRLEPHWYQLCIPADCMREVAEVLIREADRRDEKLERRAIQEEGQPSDEATLARDREWAHWEPLIEDGAVDREWVERMMAERAAALSKPDEDPEHTARSSDDSERTVLVATQTASEEEQ